MKILLPAAALAVAFSVPAFAQDSSDTPFNGPWVGITGGYDNVRAEAGNASGNKDGFLYGVGVGYDFNAAGAVVGVEAELSDSTTKQTYANNILIPGDTARLAMGRDIYAGVRVGGAIAPNVMLYAKGGYTNAQIKNVYDSNQGLRVSDNANVDGYRLGAGMEYSRGRALARLEYRYSNYGSDGNGAGAFAGPDLKRHQVAVTGGVRF